VNDPLAPLLADGVIDEVVARLKSGKEADLWLVRHGGHVVAAKVYKARRLRSFKNDAGYKEGRRVRDTRTQRAMDRGSRFGQAAAEEAWKAKEADALHALHAAGVRVPRPVMFYEGVLLMELVVDAHGHPAPRLVDAHVKREQAAALYADLRGQAVRMLGCDLIHGDLSPYNVLLGRDGPVVIDFPQVIGAAHNSQAEAYFHRDLENLRRFLAGIDPALRAAASDAREIWRAYVRRELTPEFVPSARPEEPPQGHGHGREGRVHGHAPSPGPVPGAGRAQGHGQAPGHGSERARGERQPHPAGVAAPRRARGAGAPAAAEPRGRPPGGPPGPRPPGRRGPEGRRGAPAPVVIRVARPPLGGAARPAAALRPEGRPRGATHAPPSHAPIPRPEARPQGAPRAPAPHAPPPQAHAPQPAGAPHPPGRRRRRRRRGGRGGPGGGPSGPR